VRRHLKLNDIELVSKPEYYREYIIAIIGELLETEGCAPAIAQRENQHPQPGGHGLMTRTASARTIASSSAAVFLTFGMAAACRASRLLSRECWRTLQRERQWITGEEAYCCLNFLMLEGCAAPACGPTRRILAGHQANSSAPAEGELHIDAGLMPPPRGSRESGRIG
jgi:hypothetical protein